MTSLIEFALYLFRFNMILRIYSLFVLLWDINLLLIYTFFSILESFLQFFRPPKEKSIVGDIVLVCMNTFINMYIQNKSKSVSST